MVSMAHPGLCIDEVPKPVTDDLAIESYSFSFSGLVLTLFDAIEIIFDPFKESRLSSLIIFERVPKPWGLRIALPIKARDVAPFVSR